MSAETERDKGWWLSELLAIIHRDGGHYESVHGTKKAVEDAHTVLAAALSTEPGEAEGWQPVETAPKGTIVNVVGRYKHATAGYPRYAAFNEEVNEWFEYSKHKPEPLVVWAWRPREGWPDEPAAPLPEGTRHGR